MEISYASLAELAPVLDGSGLPSELSPAPKPLSTKKMPPENYPRRRLALSDKVDDDDSVVEDERGATEEGVQNTTSTDSVAYSDMSTRYPSTVALFAPSTLYTEYASTLSSSSCANQSKKQTQSRPSPRSLLTGVAMLFHDILNRRKSVSNAAPPTSGTASATPATNTRTASPTAVSPIVATHTTALSSASVSHTGNAAASVPQRRLENRMRGMWRRLTSSRNGRKDEKDQRKMKLELAVEWETIVKAKLSSGLWQDRVEGCHWLQSELKGERGNACRNLVESTNLISTLLKLCQHKHTAVAAMYTLQLFAATADPDSPGKILLVECHAIETIIASLCRSQDDYNLDTDAYHCLMAHTLATLLNICIGSNSRKDMYLQDSRLLLRLTELLQLDNSPRVQTVCANLLSSLALGGSASRKETIASMGVVPRLVRLLSPEVGATRELRCQAVVTLRSVVHSNKVLQQRVAAIPGIDDALEALLIDCGARPSGNSGPKYDSHSVMGEQSVSARAVNEVEIALKVLAAARACGVNDQDSSYESFGTDVVLMDAPTIPLVNAIPAKNTFGEDSDSVARIAEELVARVMREAERLRSERLDGTRV